MRNGEGIEVVVIKTVGGPYPGVHQLPITLVGNKFPMPEELVMDSIPEYHEDLKHADVLVIGGAYKKKSESVLPDGDSPYVIRGAEYHWCENV